MSIVVVKVGSGAGRDFATAPAAWAGTPQDLVANDISLLIFEFYNDSIFNLGNSRLVLDGKNTDANHRIILRAAAGQGFRTNPNAPTNAYRYDPANGVAFQFSDGYYATAIEIRTPYVTLEGLQISATGGSDGALVRAGEAFNGVEGTVIDSCILRQAGNGGYVRALNMPIGLVRNTLAICDNGQSDAFQLGGLQRSRAENCTVVRPSNWGSYGVAFGADRDGVKIVNCAAFGFDTFYNQTTYGLGDPTNNATDKNLINTGLNNLVYADQFVDNRSATADFRTKTGSALINAGLAPASDNVNAPVGARQQGTAADIGSWEFAEAVQSPTATVTNIAVDGQKVTISGTTTGNPTSGTVALKVVNVPYNFGQAVDAAAVTLGAGVFSIVFNNVLAGRYGIDLQVKNSAFSAVGTNPVGDVTVNGAMATSLVQDPIDGQMLRIRGTVNDKGATGVLEVPADASNPDGAIAQTRPVTIDNSTGQFTVSVPLSPGNYAAPALLFTNSFGTSLPQAGTSPVQIEGIDGNPEAPGSGSDIPQPIVTGVTVTPGTATGSTTFTATVQGTNNPPQTVGWQASAGNITAGGVFTAPAATNVVQTITITATSAIDSTQSGTATVTIAASTQAPNPTVSSVSVSPSATAVTGGSTKQFSATVVGTNSPPQDVTWSASAGVISGSGLFTAPAATDAVQTITVTAASVLTPSKTGTATVTIAAAAPPAATVTAVNIAPTIATVAGGATKQFAAAVDGTNSPPQTVTWSATAGDVSSSGLFTAPAATSVAQVVTVTATSTYDINRSGTAIVTVPANGTTPGNKTATIQLVNASGVAIAQGTVVKFAWFDQATPDQFSVPTDKGTVSVSAGGVIKLPLAASSKSSGQVGWATVTNSDGNPATIHKAFSGPVKVD